MDGVRSLSLVFLLLIGSSVAAEPFAQQARFSRASSQQVTFGRSSVKVGQKAEQTVLVELSLSTRTRHGAEVLEKAETALTRTRKRVVKTTAIDSGLAIGAEVHYLKSELAKGGAQPAEDLIAGKTYLCQRRGEVIHVQTALGEIPSEEEFKLVAENMDTLGRPNPLAGYLAGKSVAIGDRLALPVEVARQLLGASDQLGDVTRFELTLTKIEEVAGRQCAVFQADIEAQRTDASQMRLLIDGPMTIETATCRAVSSQLSGPIGMSQSVPDPRGRLLLDSTGKIALRVSSRFKDDASAK